MLVSEVCPDSLTGISRFTIEVTCPLEGGKRCVDALGFQPLLKSLHDALGFQPLLKSLHSQEGTHLSSPRAGSI
jgi:hypothetical protein